MRDETCNFERLMLWIESINKFSSKAQVIKSLTNPQALNSLSKCKVVVMKVRYWGGDMILNIEEFMANRKYDQHPFGSSPTKTEIKLLTFLSDLDKVISPLISNTTIIWS